MFRKLRQLFTPVEVTPERWAKLHQNRMTPDQLIAESIVAKFAADFEAWEAPMQLVPAYLVPRSDFCQTRELKSKKRNSRGQLQKSVVVTFHFQIDNYEYIYKKCEVNGIEIDAASGRRIFNAYSELKKKHDALKKAAADALARQQALEKKWDLAEHITGFTRDGVGQLKGPEKCGACRHGGCHPGCEECCYCEDEEAVA